MKISVRVSGSSVSVKGKINMKSTTNKEDYIKITN